ncbi:expressed unknown protein [Seminavis robusta]|uniref:Uncharacterized protein n=1 Tax=Seminavis robusta TaxID=568900 RepID=A0A9N8ESR2_9STRA|nr:expressed unknown protein [Seminavis robusta]|eukprot:Sro1573_g283440.1 n/a (303) ;mRNA; f:11781-12689
MNDGKTKISKLFGGKRVDFCHNPTAMAHDDDYFGFVGDLSQAGTQKLGRITTEVNALVAHLKAALSAVGKRGVVVHIAHSQGALVTALAVRQLTLVEMNRLEIIAFGGATALVITPTTPFRRCVNYYAANDPLLLLVPAAQEALRSGFVGSDEYCFLAPREGDPMADHGLLGLTYGRALEWEGLRFQRKYQSPVYRATRTLIVWWMAVLQLLYTRVVQGLLVRPLLWWCRTNYQSVVMLRELFKSRILPPILIAALVVADFVVATWGRLTGQQEYLPANNLLLVKKKQRQQNSRKIETVAKR